MKKPFRFWMTSGVAIMVAAVSGSRSFAGEHERLTLAKISRYGVSETVQRIEASAQRHGMHVLACLPQKLNEVTGESRYMLVFESSQGGTPVMMKSEGAKPDLLLTLYLKQASTGGGTEVFLHQDTLHDLPEGLSDQLHSELAGLPVVVDEALTG